MAIIWEPDNPKTPAWQITNAELLDKASSPANVLKAQGVLHTTWGYLVYASLTHQISSITMTATSSGVPLT